MPRVLTAYDKSTPTYVFNITDYLESGVDVANMSVMMCLRITAQGITTPYKRYVVPNANVQGSDFNWVISEDPETNEVWQDESYCRNHGNGKFSVTVPLWRFGRPVSTTIPISYQVFIYNAEVARSDVKPGTPKEFTVVPGLIRRHNVLIDSGTITLQQTFFPMSSTAFDLALRQTCGFDEADIQTLAALNFDQNDKKSKGDLTNGEVALLASLSSYEDFSVEYTTEEIDAMSQTEYDEAFQDILDRIGFTLYDPTYTNKKGA